MSTRTDNLTAIIEPGLAALNYDLLGCEFVDQGKDSILRVFIDKEDGVTIDDCGRASRHISVVLDVEDPIRGHYNLEVSTPGIERPLFKLDHYRQFVGHKIKIKLTMPLADKRNFIGELKSVADDDLTLQVEGETFVIPFDQVQKGKLVVDDVFK